MFVAILTSAR